MDTTAIIAAMRKRAWYILFLLLVVVMIVIVSNSGPMALAFLPVCVPVLIVFYICYRRHTSLPKDAAPIVSPESDQILGELAGEWDIIPVNTGGCILCGSNMHFSKVYFRGTAFTLSGGRRGRSYTQQLYLSRTPTGTLYLDKFGSYVTEWNKVSQEIHITTSNNGQQLWRRPLTFSSAQAAAPVYHQPVVAAPVVVFLPAWWETHVDPSGRTYYKNNHTMKTSWTPPTAAQIAQETRERNARGEEEGEGAAPLAYNPPPAYNATTASAPPPAY